MLTSRLPIIPAIKHIPEAVRNYDEFHEVETSKNQKVILDDIQVPVQTNVAAGIPVLELVKRYEEEHILTRVDRMAFYESFQDANRRDILIQALADVEIGTNPRFSIQRLKAHIHQNPGGLPNGKTALPRKIIEPIDNRIYNKVNVDNVMDNSPESRRVSNAQVHKTDGMVLLPIVQGPLPSASPSKVTSLRPIKHHSPGSRIKNQSMSDDSFTNGAQANIKEAISEIVGDTPVYKHTYNVCQKLEERLIEHLIKYSKKRTKNKLKLGVIIGSGSCNPLTRMHMRRFYLAKQYLESRSDIFILGSLVSPTHHSVVRERYRNNLSEIMPSPHRLAMANMMVSDSKWISVDPWETTRKRSMDYLSLLEHLRETIQNHTYCGPENGLVSSTIAAHANMKDYDIKIYYLCKPNVIPLLSPSALKAYNFHVVCVCRPPESEYLRTILGSRWNGCITVVEDDAILDCSVDTISSNEVRSRIKHGESVATLMGGVAEEYLQYHKIGSKMNGEIDYTEEEKLLPKMKCSYGFIKHSHAKPSVDVQQVLSNNNGTIATIGEHVPVSAVSSKVIPSRLAVLRESSTSQKTNYRVNELQLPSIKLVR